MDALLVLFLYILTSRGSYRKELWRTLSVAVLCLRVSVGVFMLDTLHQRKKRRKDYKFKYLFVRI